jgi:multicomponent Na+:H+ antiporter subunit B
MRSLVLRTATRYMQPILLLFSVFLLLKGHNEPGGGFAGGLVAASAFALYAIAYSVDEARENLRVAPQTLIGLGLLLALGSGVVAMLLGQPFMTGQWGEVTLPGFGKVALGTPVLFDVGVYLDVVGVTLLIIFSLAEEE